MELAERAESRFEVIDKILDICEASDGLFFRVQWERLPDKRDWTWQPVGAIFLRRSGLVADFLPSCKSRKKLVNKVKHQLAFPQQCRLPLRQTS